jgi:hypothetical protein
LIGARVPTKIRAATGRCAPVFREITGIADTHKIFAKLEIHTREELIIKLLALDNPLCVLAEPFSWGTRH